MILTQDTIRDYNIKPQDIKKRFIGNLRYSVLMVQVSAEQYKKIMRYFWADSKRESRNRRCLIQGKNQKLIRCPETKSCKECSVFRCKYGQENSSISLSTLLQEDMEPVCTDSFEDTVIFKIFLHDVITKLKKLNPTYAQIFYLLCTDITHREIAKKVNMKQQTLSDHVKKIREIVRPLFKEYFEK